MYQIFEKGKPISKPYPFKQQAYIDCYERGLVVSGDGYSWFSGNIEIREIEDIDEEKAI